MAGLAAASAARGMSGEGGAGAGLGFGGPGPSGISQGDVATDLSSRTIVNVAPAENVLGEILKFANADQPLHNGGLGMHAVSPFSYNVPGSGSAASGAPSSSVNVLLIGGLAAGAAALIFIMRKR